MFVHVQTCMHVCVCMYVCVLMAFRNYVFVSDFVCARMWMFVHIMH